MMILWFSVCMGVVMFVLMFCSISNDGLIRSDNPVTRQAGLEKASILMSGLKAAFAALVVGWAFYGLFSSFRGE